VRFDSLLESVGRTPLVGLPRLSPSPDVRLWAKLEQDNPTGSVKDRAALYMVSQAEKEGLLRPGVTVLEPTSGNTGISLAMVCKLRGYRLICVMPENTSIERRQLLTMYGAEIVTSPAAGGSNQAVAVAKELAAENPDWVMLYQYGNPANALAHYETTGPEILEQMEGRVDAWVAGAGTGGTFTGVAKYLREHLPDVQCYVVEPQGSILKGGEAGPHEVEGIGASSFIPPVLDMTLATDVIRIDDDPAFDMVARLAAEEGILGASSAGANVAAALEVARRLGPGKRVVTLIPDPSERYMSKGVYSRWRVS
jgi:cysteine synthase